MFGSCNDWPVMLITAYPNALWSLFLSSFQQVLAITFGSLIMSTRGGVRGTCSSNISSFSSPFMMFNGSQHLMPCANAIFFLPWINEYRIEVGTSVSVSAVLDKKTSVFTHLHKHFILSPTVIQSDHTWGSTPPEAGWNKRQFECVIRSGGRNWPFSFGSQRLAQATSVYRENSSSHDKMCP